MRLMIAEIAEVAHEVNRAYCESIGDFSQPAWRDAPDWQTSSAINGVDAIIRGKVKTPEESHENWLAQKRSEGWKWGPVKNQAKKEHPCFCPYSDLPVAQRTKDHLFRAIVTTLSALEDFPIDAPPMAH